LLTGRLLGPFCGAEQWPGTTAHTACANSEWRPDGCSAAAGIINEQPRSGAHGTARRCAGAANKELHIASCDNTCGRAQDGASQ
jgi:hypothetical protein